MHLQLLQHQEEFFFSETKHTVLVAGFGSGKTEGAVTKAVVKLLTTPKSLNVGYYLPNYPLINDIAVPRFTQFFEDHSIRFKYHSTEKVFYTQYGSILLRNMTKPETIVGYETFYAIVDEIDVLPKTKAKAVFNKIIARNRQIDTGGKINQIDLVSTPEGYRFLYEFCEDGKNPNKKVIHAKTSNNPFLPSDYIETLTNQYTSEELTAYLNGEFCNLTSGSVYKSYKRDLHDCKDIPEYNEDLYIGMDFNVGNMHAIVHVIRSGRLIAVDEFVKIYDTYELCNLIREKYPYNKIEINPDASCRNRNTAGLSDYDIINDEAYDFIITIRRKNPEILNRVRGVNKAFETCKYFVNLEKCPTYSAALNQQAYKDGLPDKTSGFDHINDAGTYCVIEQIYVSCLD